MMMNTVSVADRGDAAARASSPAGARRLSGAIRERGGLVHLDTLAGSEAESESEHRAERGEREAALSQLQRGLASKE